MLHLLTLWMLYISLVAVGTRFWVLGSLAVSLWLERVRTRCLPVMYLGRGGPSVNCCYLDGCCVVCTCISALMLCTWAVVAEVSVSRCCLLYAHGTQYKKEVHDIRWNWA